ncbi:MAG: selenide, water dikinase SelD [Bacillota bacterium]
MTSEKIALTQTVQKGGCAAKVSATELRRILQRVKFPKPHPELMIDGRLFDDAAIYKVTDDVAMVQTLDFFTPIVDSPKMFGAVAAANALSDVYAMGGKPKTAMGILAFPLATMTDDVIVEVMQGASDKIAEAGANFVGGHSIDDDTLKFGLSVTGFVHPAQVWSNAGAQPGDHLILTKALGTGTMTAALKRREASEDEIKDALESMATINNAVDFLSEEQRKAVHAATDITGFGLSGHSMQLAKASEVTLKIRAVNLPKFSKALHYLEKSFLTKAHRTNAEYTATDVDTSALDSLHRLLVHDPQTSGGLLLSVPATLSAEILQALQKKFSVAQVIGEVLPRSEKAVVFE